MRVFEAFAIDGKSHRSGKLNGEREVAQNHREERNACDTNEHVLNALCEVDKKNLILTLDLAQTLIFEKMATTANNENKPAEVQSVMVVTDFVWSSALPKNKLSILNSLL